MKEVANTTINLIGGGQLRVLGNVDDRGNLHLSLTWGVAHGSAILVPPTVENQIAKVKANLGLPADAPASIEPIEQTGV